VVVVVEQALQVKVMLVDNLELLKVLVVVEVLVQLVQLAVIQLQVKEVLVVQVLLLQLQELLLFTQVVVVVAQMEDHQLVQQGDQVVVVKEVL
jgi:hypothetical protein